MVGYAQSLVRLRLLLKAVSKVAESADVALLHEHLSAMMLLSLLSKTALIHLAKWVKKALYTNGVWLRSRGAQMLFARSIFSVEALLLLQKTKMGL